MLELYRHLMFDIRVRRVLAALLCLCLLFCIVFERNGTHVFAPLLIPVLLLVRVLTSERLNVLTVVPAFQFLSLLDTSSPRAPPLG
jgi:hypothetical protein